MNPNLMEQFLGPSSDFFRFNTNDINILVTPIDKKTSLLTKRNVFRTTATTSSATLAVLNSSLACSTLSSFCAQLEPATTPPEASLAPPKPVNTTTTTTANKVPIAETNTTKSLVSASTPKLSLKDKYKHVKSTIPPPRAVNPSAAHKSSRPIAQLRSKSSNSIKDSVARRRPIDFASESAMSFNCHKTLSNENICLDESIYNDENSNADCDEELNCSSVYEDNNHEVSCK
jgi:hypothetical protein